MTLVTCCVTSLNLDLITEIHQIICVFDHMKNIYIYTYTYIIMYIHMYIYIYMYISLYVLTRSLTPAISCHATAGAILCLLQSGHHQPRHGARHGAAEKLSFCHPHRLPWRWRDGVFHILCDRLYWKKRD